MKFLDITDELAEIVLNLVKGKQLIDCGAGSGQLQSIKDQVTSIDLYPQADHVLKMDAITFPFIRSMIPIFIRPCHSGFVGKTICEAMKVGSSFALYIGFEENLEKDLGLMYRRVCITNAVKNWIGPDNEIIFKITPVHADNDNLQTYVLICNKRYGFVWWARTEGDRIYNSAGGYQHLNSDIEVLETVKACGFDELDFTKTSLVKPDSDAGWLSRDGVWHGCGFEQHDTYAYRILKISVEDLENKGWCRVYGPPNPEYSSNRRPTWIVFSRLSAEQRNELSRRGHLVSDTD